jgi:hypothetical protein
MECRMDGYTTDKTARHATQLGFPVGGAAVRTDVFLNSGTSAVGLGPPDAVLEGRKGTTTAIDLPQRAIPTIAVVLSAACR